MTDKEIKEAKSLRWLAVQFPKVENPKDDVDKMQNCINIYCTNAADLINRQQAENENYSHNIKNLTAENMQLHAEIKRLNSCVKSEDEVRAIMKSQMTPMVKEIVNEQIDVAAKLARAEAIKEFAERLKKHSYFDPKDQRKVVAEVIIDHYIKEMECEGK